MLWLSTAVHEFTHRCWGAECGFLCLYKKTLLNEQSPLPPPIFCISSLKHWVGLFVSHSSTLFPSSFKHKLQLYWLNICPSDFSHFHDKIFEKCILKQEVCFDSVWGNIEHRDREVMVTEVWSNCSHSVLSQEAEGGHWDHSARKRTCCTRP